MDSSHDDLMPPVDPASLTDKELRQQSPFNCNGISPIDGNLKLKDGSYKN